MSERNYRNTVLPFKVHINPIWMKDERHQLIQQLAENLIGRGFYKYWAFKVLCEEVLDNINEEI